jgi:hypothetical protein
VVTTDKGWETWVSDTGLTAEEVQAVHDRYQAILAERTTVRNKIDPAPALQPDSPTPEPEEPQPKPTGPSSLLHDAYSRVTSPNGIGGDGLDFSGGTSVSDQVPFISAQRSHEMEEEPAVCRGGIDVVRDRDEPDIPLLQVVDNRKQVPLSRWEAMFWVGEETRVLDAGLTAEEVQAVHERYQTILAERNRPSI